MNYERIYNQIVERAQSEVEYRILQKKNKSGYFEGHHIILESLGGEGKSTDWYQKDINKRHPNIVGLTAKEHFLCHWLLHRMYPTNHSIGVAWWRMIVQDKNGKRYKPSGRVFEEARIAASKNISQETRNKISKALKGIKRSEETRKKYSLAQLGNQKGKNVRHTEEFKQRLSRERKGVPRTDAVRKKLKEAQAFRKGVELSDEVKLKISSKLKGRVFSEEHRNKIAEANRRRAFKRKLSVND